MGDIGKVFRVRNWDHCTPNATISYGLGRKRKNRVAIMVYLGEEAIDGSDPIDFERTMMELGWKPTAPRDGGKDAG